MKPEVFNSCWGMLINVYASAPGTERITPETQRIYYRALQRIPDALFINGSDRAYKDRDGGESSYFPSVARLGAKSMGCDDWEAEIDRREELAKLAEARKHKRLEPPPDEEERARVKKMIADLADKFSFPKG